MAAREELALRNLTIFLLKEGIETPNNAIRPDKYQQHQKIVLKSGAECDFYVQPPSPRPPRWASIFQGYVSPHLLGQVSSTAAVLLLKTNNRFFALTFGHGRYLLQPSIWEERFGLCVTLNSVGDKNIRSIDKKTFDAIAKHSREQAIKEVEAQEFGMDVERDLLRAVTGSPSDVSLGNRLSGMDALHATVRADLEDVPELLERYYQKYLDNSYKKKFPWVDHIAEVSDRLLIEKLDESMAELLRHRELECCWLAVPEIIDWTRIDGFQFARSKRSPILHDISFPHFLDGLSNPSEVSIGDLKSKYVHCLDPDGAVIEHWPVYKCANAELEIGDGSFLLSGGKWYRVDKDFVTQVNAAVEKIDRVNLEWPEFADKSEGSYNKRIAGDQKVYALMDAQSIFHGGGQSQIEFCDLFSKSGDIVHVKRYGASSVFSHFFSQGLVAGELFVADPVFRGKLNDKLPESHRLEDAQEPPSARNYRVVYAVISEEEDGLTLPFFSRLNLKHAARRLMGFGYQVALAKIPVENKYKKTKRYAPS